MTGPVVTVVAPHRYCRNCGRLKYWAPAADTGTVTAGALMLVTMTDGAPTSLEPSNPAAVVSEPAVTTPTSSSPRTSRAVTVLFTPRSFHAVAASPADVV